MRGLLWVGAWVLLSCAALHADIAEFRRFCLPDNRFIWQQLGRGCAWVSESHVNPPVACAESETGEVVFDSPNCSWRAHIPPVPDRATLVFAREEYDWVGLKSFGNCVQVRASPSTRIGTLSVTSELFTRDSGIELINSLPRPRNLELFGFPEDPERFSPLQARFAPDFQPEGLVCEVRWLLVLLDAGLNISKLAELILTGRGWSADLGKRLAGCTEMRCFYGGGDVCLTPDLVDLLHGWKKLTHLRCQRFNTMVFPSEKWVEVASRLTLLSEARSTERMTPSQVLSLLSPCKALKELYLYEEVLDFAEFPEDLLGNLTKLGVRVETTRGVRRLRKCTSLEMLDLRVRTTLELISRPEVWAEADGLLMASGTLRFVRFTEGQCCLSTALVVSLMQRIEGLALYDSSPVDPANLPAVVDNCRLSYFSSVGGDPAVTALVARSAPLKYLQLGAYDISPPALQAAFAGNERVKTTLEWFEVSFNRSILGEALPDDMAFAKCLSAAKLDGLHTFGFAGSSARHAPDRVTCLADILTQRPLRLLLESCSTAEVRELQKHSNVTLLHELAQAAD